MSDVKKSYSGIYVVMGMLFVSCLLVSNLIAGKLWELPGEIVLPASVILFPVTYILADIFTEIYGYEKTRLIIWAGFLCNFSAVAAYVITTVMPYPKYWLDQDAYAIVLGTTPRVLIASLFAYLVGEFSNSIILSRLKVTTKGSKLWLRTIGSTVVGEALDSLIFITISYIGSISAGQLLKMILFQYLFKVGFEVVLTPVTYKVIGILKKKEGIDTYDYEQKYKIF